MSKACGLFILLMLFIQVSTASIAPVSKILNRLAGKVNVPKYKNDAVIAKHLVDLSKSFSIYKINQYSINNLLAKVKRKSTFSLYRKTIRRAHAIAGMKLQIRSIRKRCQQVSKEKLAQMTYLNALLNKRMNRYCQHKFLSMLNNRKKQIRVGKAVGKYLKQSVRYYLRGEFHDRFLSYLKRTSVRPARFKKVSNIIISALVSENIRPTDALLNIISMNEKLDSYMSEIGPNTSEIRRYFNKGLVKLSRGLQSALKDEEIDLATDYANLLLAYHKQNKKFISNSLTWRHYISCGREFYYRDELQQAKRFFQKATEVSSGTKQEEAIFQMIWLHLRNNNFDLAKDEIERYQLLDRWQSLNNKTKFWIAYTLHTEGDTGQAKTIFKSIVKNTPLSYYSIISGPYIKDEDISLEQLILNKLSTIPSKKHVGPKHYSSRLKNLLLRLSIWIDLKEERFASKIINEIHALPANEIIKKVRQPSHTDYKHLQRSVALTLSNLLLKKRQHLHLFRLVQGHLRTDLFDLDGLSLQLLFPTKYLKYISKKKINLDPYLVLSLIRQESAFNPRARSTAGARGLMQLLPSTARQMKRRLRAPQLENPSLNIRLGSKYLKKLIKRYQGNLVYALAAYNAGMGNLKKWQPLILNSEDPFITIDSIPFKETRQYVKLVLRNKYFYGLLNQSKTSTKGNSLRDQLIIATH